MKHVLVCAMVLVCFAGWASTALAEGPAVSKVNGKISVLGGNIDGDSASIAAGTLSIPVGERIGLQFDAAYGELDDDIQAKGAGLHLFTRDPDQYLLGVVGTYSVIEDVDYERYALEAEYYLKNFSLVGKVGQQQGDIDTDGFGKISLRWYPAPDVMLAVGGSFAGDDDNYGYVGAEAQVYKGLALFANLAFGEDNYDHVMVGARYYFGDKKDLIKRHREDDPNNEVVDGFTETLKEVGEAMSEPVCPDGYVYSPGWMDDFRILLIDGPEVPEYCMPYRGEKPPPMDF